MLRLKYNGAKHNLETMFRDAAAQRIKEYFKQKLKPFENEINAAGGKVNYDMEKSKLFIENIPEELKLRIIEAMKNS